MSYSVNTQKSTLGDALDDINNKLDEVVEREPKHDVDVELVRQNLDVLSDNIANVDEDGYDIVMSASGSYSSNEQGIQSFSMSCGVSKILRT